MNIFIKAAAAIFGRLVRHGIQNDYYQFLTHEEEYNPNVLSCFDIDDGKSSLIALLTNIRAKLDPEQDCVNLGYCVQFTFKFEKQEYDLTQFYHYMRTINVMVTVRCKRSISKMVSFVNEINLKDKMHQVGFQEQDGVYYLSVTRPFLIMPLEICNSEQFAQGLRELKIYAHQLAKMEMPDEDYWKQCATFSPREPVPLTAHDFWFSQENNVLKRFSEQGRLISSSNGEEVHKMINIYDSAVDGYYAAKNIFERGTITTYSEYPYLSLLQVNLSEKDKGCPELTEEKVFVFCTNWNSAYHMAPCKATYYTDENGHLNIRLTMICLYADTTNTRTYADLLCSMEKATYIMIDSLRQL